MIGYKWSLLAAAAQFELPSFPTMIRHFLYDQLYPNSRIPSSELSTHAYPEFCGKISIFYNATATFRAPSDFSGIGCMRREYIRATPSWRRGSPRYDPVFINSDPSLEGMRGLKIHSAYSSLLRIHTQGKTISVCPYTLVFPCWRWTR